MPNGVKCSSLLNFHSSLGEGRRWVGSEIHQFSTILFIFPKNAHVSPKPLFITEICLAE